MRKSALLVLLFQSIFYCYAQPSIVWQKSFGGTGDEVINSIEQTTDGGYVMAGYSNSNNNDVSGNHGERDYWVVKLTSTGGITWQKSLGGTDGESATSILQTTDGGYIVAGSSDSNNGDVSGNHGDYDCWIVKLSSTGTIQWQKSLGGTLRDYASSILQTTDGGYIVAGQSDSIDGNVSGNHGNSDCWLVKLDILGGIEWQKSFGGSLDETACTLYQTKDGGYIFAGDSNSNNFDVSGNHGSIDIWVVKLTSAGTIVWQKSLGGSGVDATYSVLQSADGGYVVGGYSNSNNGDIAGNHGDFDYWVVKLNSDGLIEWKKSLGGTALDQAYSIRQTSDGGFVVGGFSNSVNGDVSGNHGDFDYWLVKLTGTGTVEWQKSFGGSGADRLTAIRQTSDGGYIIAGQSNSNNNDVSGNHGGTDCWIVKLSSFLSTDEMDFKNLFSVFPNPANNEIHINKKKPIIDFPYVIYDQLGRSVMTGRLDEEDSVIEIGNLSKGFYILSIGDKIKTNTKIIKE